MFRLSLDHVYAKTVGVVMICILIIAIPKLCAFLSLILLGLSAAGILAFLVIVLADSVRVTAIVVTAPRGLTIPVLFIPTPRAIVWVLTLVAMLFQSPRLVPGRLWPVWRRNTHQLAWLTNW